MAFKVNEVFALDTETTGLSSWHGCRPFAVSIISDEGDTWYCQWEVDPFTRTVAPRQADLDFIQSLCGNPKLRMAAFNLKFDRRMLECFGVEFKCHLDEVNFMARIFNTQELPARLKPLARKYCDIDDADEKDLHADVVRARRQGRALGYNLGEDVAEDYWLPHQLDPTNKLCETYAVTDAFRTLALYFFYKIQFDKDAQEEDPTTEGDLWGTYHREMQLEPIIYEIEGRGVRLDIEKNTILHAEYLWMAVEGEKKLKEITGNPNFNYEAHQQVGAYMYGTLGLECEEYTDKGNPKTDAKALRAHVNNPFVSLVLHTKAAKKAATNFFEKHGEMAVPDTIWIPEDPNAMALHTDFLQLDTRTTRLSSRRPNLQQVADPSVSTRTPIPVYARTPFGPRKGYYWYTVDYAQQELRIFADVAGSETMIAACMNGRDINNDNANRAWGGKGNHRAISAAVNSLNLGSQDVKDEHVAAVWKKYGWNYELASKGMDSPEAQKFAEAYLALFDYDIIKMEKSLDKKAVRNRAKMVFFAKIYGGGPKAVTALLYCSFEEAKEFMDVFDTEFPEIARYTGKLTRRSRINGYIVNPYKRRIHIDYRHAYKCVNYMIQSTAADMMKDSLVKCHAFLRSTGLDAHIVLTVHDEIVFEIKKGHDHEWVLKKLCELMSDNGGRLKVPMEVEMQRAEEQWNQKIKVDLED